MVCVTLSFLSFVVLLSSPLTFYSCSNLPLGLREAQPIQLDVDLLPGAGHRTSSCELLVRDLQSFGQARLLPGRDLPHGRMQDFATFHFAIGSRCCNTFQSEQLLVVL